MRKRFDDEEERPGGFWRFIRGVVFALLVSVGAVVVLSVYVLPPPEPPAPEPVAADTGPEMVSGIEVATTPAYTGSFTGASGPDAPATQPKALGPIELSGPAFSVNAAPFEAEPDMPLVAVVLDDTASDPLLHGMLFSTGMPLTVGVIAGGDGDRETATAAREAGIEVVAQLPMARQGQSGGAGLEYGLPEGEAADRTMILIQRLPMAVAVSRPLAAPAPPNATVLYGILSVLSPLGFAYVDHGVAPADSSAAEAVGLGGIVGVSRQTIPAGAGAAEILAVLDLAAAEAARRGGAVVFAAPGEQLVLALQLWGGEGSASAARLAPLSAVIQRQRGR
ncbi:MAG: divergent polysaccharide deacetylase family protein [Alphaproteobacteria bacterium]